MLNIYTGRENLDKDRFMFDQIKGSLEKGKRVILIVPDQYTLQAEKNAFEYLNVDGLMDLEVLSFSRLAGRVFAEVGGGLKTFVNNYGKFMMISRVLLSENPNLKVFKDLEGSADFIEKTNNFISEIKNHNITPKDLNMIIDSEDGDSLLLRKLEDISRVFELYEMRMGSDMIDTADYLSMFVSKIRGSELIKNSEFWVSGFDYLTPKNIDGVLEISTTTSSNVNIVLTAERDNSFFKSTNILGEDLRMKALEKGLDAKIMSIPRDYRIDDTGREPLSHLESQYSSLSAKVYDRSSSQNIEMVSAANFYSEAETAAAKITELIRDRGMRYRDILVICNDMEARASVIKRVFSEYGLPIFVDQRRGIHHNPALEYIMTLLDIVAEGWRPDLIFKLLKTGLTSLTTMEIEELENYSIKFKIIGGKWKREFYLTAGEYSDEEIDTLNEIRSQVVDLVSGFEKRFKKVENVKHRTASLFNYLNDEVKLPYKIDDYKSELEASGELEYAEEMAQVWEVILGIFDQFVNILGDEELSYDEYSVILKTGFESIQLGMLPPSIDQILLGTMQRTRTGSIKALFVLGANDGILPSYSGEETLLNDDEREFLYRKGNVICRNDEQIMREEQLAIYRNLSKPSEYLFMSYSVSDTEGGEIRPSIIFERVRKMFPQDRVQKDILNRDGDSVDLIQGIGSTANHLTDVMRDWVINDLMPDIWKSVYDWFDANKPGITRRIINGLSFRNNREKIDEDFITELYKPTYDESEDVIISSPSGLENFSRCPFSFLLGRGIRLKERRVYELDGRNIGDVYHETLMRFGRSMCTDGKKPLDPDSKWNTMTDDECKSVVSDIYNHIEETYNDGLFKETAYEEYRSGRFKKIITDVALELKNQVNAGRIEDMFFETEFRENSKFNPIVVEKDGKKVKLTGKIDRLDILSGGYAKVVDYKSGSDELITEDILKGWQLQLMIYMNAVTKSDSNLKPAGVFYFKIPEPRIETTKLTPEEIREEILGKMESEYKMDGLVINDKSVVESITGNLDSKTSKIISAKVNKDFPDEAAGKSVLPKEDFNAIETTVSSLITELCESILDGDIKANPKESKKKKITACTYCDYKGICGYDKSFE